MGPVLSNKQQAKFFQIERIGVQNSMEEIQMWFPQDSKKPGIRIIHVQIKQEV